MERNNEVSGMVVNTRGKREILYVTLSGKFILAEALSDFLEVLEAIEEKQNTKVVIDGRQLSGEPLTIERFLYGEFVAEAVKRLKIGGAPVFAYVLHEPVLDPMRFGETVALNRGMNLRVFDDYDLAIGWLGSVPIVSDFNNVEPPTK